MKKRAIFGWFVVFSFFAVLACSVAVQIEPKLISKAASLATKSIDEIVAMEEFDGRAWDIVTPTKDQGDSNICWAYSVVNASEVSILRKNVGTATKDTLRLLPEQVAYRYHNGMADPLGNTSGAYTGKNWYSSAGRPSNAASVLSQWCGPISASLAATADPFENAQYKMENAALISNEKYGAERIAEIKRAIATYGAVTFYYNNLRNEQYYNPRTENGSNSSPHAVCLIGWNDNIDASLFKPKAANQNGGWLVKNSYSDNDYFYISYDNDAQSEMYAFDYSAADKYDYNYFYDDTAENSLTASFAVSCGANIFEAKKGGNGKVEKVRAVNIGLYGRQISVVVEIYTNLTDATDPYSGTLSATGSAYFEYGGYRTVELDSWAAVENGTNFAVVVKSSSPIVDSGFITIAQKSCAQSKKYSSYGWNGLNGCLRIKAFTKLVDDTQTPDPTPNPGEDQTNIQNGEIVVLDRCIYNGLPQTPAVQIVVDGKILSQNVHYTLTYQSNTNAGTATVVATGVGDCFGQIETSFFIEKAQYPPMDQNQIYTKSSAKRLKDINLPDGWVWKNPEQKITNKTKDAIAVFVGNGSENYQNTQMTVVLNFKNTKTTNSKTNGLLIAGVCVCAVLVVGALSGVVAFVAIKRKKQSKNI